MVFSWHRAEFERLLARKSQLPHALLLRGREGTGKLVFAEALARALLCEHPGPERAACGRCAACTWFEQGSHPDFRRLTPAALVETGDPEQSPEKKPSQQIAVDQVREIAAFIAVSSHRGGAKVVLIYPADALNISAANALLKDLEEPPPQTYFLLVAHRWRHLPATIRSRCQHIALHPPDPAAAHAWLNSQGLRNAEVSLAQAGGAPLLARDYDDDYWRQRNEFLGKLADPGLEPLSASEQVRECTPGLALSWMQKWLFDLIFHEVTGVVRYNPDFAKLIADAAERIDMREALRFHREVVSLQGVVTHPLNPRLFIEQLLLGYAGLLRRPVSRPAA